MLNLNSIYPDNRVVLNNDINLTDCLKNPIDSIMKFMY